MELQWLVEAVEVNNGNKIFETFDLKKYYKLSEEYKTEPPSEKSKYKGGEDYVIKKGGPELTAIRRNYKKISDEIDANLEKDDYYSILPVDLYSEQATIMDLLASLENQNYIKEIYRKKKLKVSNDLKTDTSVRLKDALKQGRSLLQSAQTANMLSKPLIDFYAASAYAYAAIVINSPLHKALDSLKGSHGHSYNHLNSTVEFGGDLPSGTFIDLLASIYFSQTVTESVRLKHSTLSSLEFVQSHKINISLIALLSAVPELHEQYMRVDPSHNVVHEISIQSKVVKNKVTYVFEIGDGKNKLDIDILKKVFSVEEIEEKNGKFIVNVAANKIIDISPTIYQDIKGKLWYIEPFIEQLYLPEICLHFLIISALCNIMRYSPHEWNNILSNKISSDFSLLISKYLRLFELKFPMLLVPQFTNFLPVIKS